MNRRVQPRRTQGLCQARFHPSEKFPDRNHAFAAPIDRALNAIASNTAIAKMNKPKIIAIVHPVCVGLFGEGTNFPSPFLSKRQLYGVSTRPATLSVLHSEAPTN